MKPHKLSKSDVNYYLTAYSNIKDKVHFVEHIQAVRNNARILAKKLNYSNLDLLDAAALLHDIGNIKSKKDYHIIGANMVLNDSKLKEIFDESELKEISYSILQHRSNDSSNIPKTMLAKIINDANIMDGSIKKSYTYTDHKYPNISKVQKIVISANHIYNKYGPNGYGMKSLIFKQSKQIISDKMKDVLDARLYWDIYRLAKHCEMKLDKPKYGPMLQFRFMNWKNKKTNILFVTGLSGSGKSTLSNKLSKQYNAEYIQLDHFEWGLKDGLNPKQAITKYIIRYKELYPINITAFKNNNNKQMGPDISKFIKWLIKDLYKSNTRCIVEGVQIYNLNYKAMKELPILIMNTSVDDCILSQSLRGTGGHSPQLLSQERKNLNKFIKNIN